MRPAALIVCAAAAWMAGAGAAVADELDLILERTTFPPALRNKHGYSDFTDPLGRFMDLLAAGALEDARAIQADACRTWQATRDSSAWSGTFWVWDVRVDLDKLCAKP